MKSVDEGQEQVPTPPQPDSFPIVGIGASAGGLAAFEQFFSGMPQADDPNMAFILVQHLAPRHKSILSELISRYTRMQVREVEDGMKVRPNCTYIIPPNFDMAFINGTLQLLEPSLPHGTQSSIDFFFRSLARDQKEHAIGIVLSGTGSDGTEGLRAIKSEGGLVVVQKPDSAEFDGMPRSALSKVQVDFELTPAEMPEKLIQYASHAYGKPRIAPTALVRSEENNLKKVHVLLRSQTGHDFSEYKTSTILRRLSRRMAVNQIETLDDYVKFLQHSSAEADTLFRDLLIGVTSFFRDKKVFRHLEKVVIPKLFENKSAGDCIRVWVNGCSTGEEAYSIAILLAEHADTLKQQFNFQVFATDIDDLAIASARSGVYPASIAADITPQRLQRYFSLEGDKRFYRIQKSIRDMLVFSELDMVKDPPFSRLDLLSCRNVLIYMDAALQKKLMPLFHYSLNPGGYLLLGTSESVGEFTELFEPLQRKLKLYRRTGNSPGTAGLHFSRLAPTASSDARLNSHSSFGPTAKSLMPLREITEQALLKLTVPASALVNSRGDILYLHGRSGNYLEPAAGEPGINNIIKMAREGLQRELTTALHKAVSSKETVRRNGLKVKTNNHYSLVNLTLHTLDAGTIPTIDTPLFLVVLDEPLIDTSSGPVLANAPAESGTEVDADILEKLRQELVAKEEYLQATNEELETSNEELKSSNEEMQSINEEMQSTNEELETSKEELQSVNEELATINAELQSKVADLSQANDDMNNLLAGTGIATVFVDHQLNIQRFTPAATEIINLIPSDTGRPVGHIVSNLKNYNRLVDDTRSVLDNLVPIESEVQTREDVWYKMRIHPYRTLENVIEGAVITFVNIHEVVLARLQQRENENLLRLAVVVRDASNPITLQGLDGKILAWNSAAERIYGWKEAEALQMDYLDRVPAALKKQEQEHILRLCQHKSIEPYHTRRITRDGAEVAISLTLSLVGNDSGEPSAIASTERVLAASDSDTAQDDGD